MVMVHNADKRCPYCFSRKLKVIEYDVADKEFHKRLGKYWFRLKCTKCGGTCEDITNLESRKERLEKAEEKRRSRMEESA